jgi:hypothetical protein
MIKFVISLGLVLLASSVWAQGSIVTLIDFSGQMYEEDNTPGEVGFPPSDPGDVLAAVGFAENLSPLLPWNFADAEYTIVVSGLVSGGQMEPYPDWYQIPYAGGTIVVVADAFAGGGFTAAEYGVDPPNATAPATFADGATYLVGSIENFTMTYYAVTGTGDFNGDIVWTGGSELDEDVIGSAEGYVFSGTAQTIASPDGYDLEMVGHIAFDPAIAAEEDSWSGVKNLYR